MKGKINWIVIIPVLIIVFVIVSMTPGIRYRVGKDERAVLYSVFSGEVDKENIIEPGTRYKLPWNEVHIYNVNETQADDEFDVLDKEGNSLQVMITVRFFPIPDEIGYLQERFGEEYEGRLIIPEVRSVIRQILQRYSAEDIYFWKREEIVLAINKEAGTILQKNNIQLNELLFRSVELPMELKEALEKRLLQESLKK